MHLTRHQLVGVIFLAIFHRKIESTPVTVNITSFDDDWDFKIEPHNIPHLQAIQRNHILPSKLIEFSDKTVAKKSTDEKVTLQRTAKILVDAVRSRVSCGACKLGVGLFRSELAKDSSVEEIRSGFIEICVGLRIESEAICGGIFDVFGPEVLPVLKTSKSSVEQICSLALGETCGDIKNPQHEWKIDLPEKPKPSVAEAGLPKEGLPTFKVLHISDTHYDPEYVVGSPSNCEEPLCCRSYSTPPKNEEVIPAGKWGSYSKCDSPKALINNMLRHIADQHPDIDYIIWTGDLVPHDIWNQTKASNLAIIDDAVEQMLEMFPTIPIYPAVGNHESIPAGNFAPPWMKQEAHSIDWLYEKLSEHWSKWLPENSNNTVLHGGFYSVLIRPGFRIISINTNYCHALSWWLLVNSTDPAKELKWLVHELEMAEDRGEKVHIIGHIPPGSYDCMKVWSENFNRIVERFENTIQAQFYGHSHADEFEIFYDIKQYRKYPKFWSRLRNIDASFSERPISVAYLGPSVTTFENHNPGYRIYYVDGDHDNTTREVIDHETWTFNLDEANNGDKDPIWYQLYSARKDLKLPSLRPKEWSSLIDKLAADVDFFDLFYKFYFRDSPTRPACDSKCKLQILCDLRSAVSHHRHQLCHDLELLFSK